ncbi:MAG: hypothetical protein DDT26_02065 [Dehalococcoidia bacterium]|nr:hypothetical protein [Chloroflexota bacterium]
MYIKRIWIKAGEKFKCFQACDLWLDGKLLSLNTNVLQELGTLMHRIKAQNPYKTLICPPKPYQDFYQGCFASPVRTEKPKNLSPFLNV